MRRLISKKTGNRQSIDGRHHSGLDGAEGKTVFDRRSREPLNVNRADY